jgi:RecA/RadA recombinase
MAKKTAKTEKSKKSKKGDEEIVKKKKKKVVEEEVKSSKKSKKSKARDDDDDVGSKDAQEFFDVNAYLADTLDEVAKRQGFESSTLEAAPPVSSGLLAIDLITGGGLRAGMLTAAGEEQCAKSTLALTAMGSSINNNTPYIAFVDYEGSTVSSKPYIHSILKGQGVKLSMDEVFGKRAPSGKWEIRPRVRFRAETSLEKFYEWLSAMLREMPDKRYIEHKWWLVFEDNKKNKAKVGNFVDKSMTRKYGNGLWVASPDGNLQGVVFVDSYTAMNPDAKDKEEISNQYSVKASAFSKQLERIKGRMLQKMVMVYGLNHLRDNPGVMFGEKQTEKGGKALKQFSDVRFRQASRALSAAKGYFNPKPGKGTFNEVEQSVESRGKDEYRYVSVKAIKNKLWVPNRQALLRVWIHDGKGVARGIDPVFDTAFYLKETGQISGTREKLLLDLHSFGKAEKSITWDQLKLWILGDKTAMKGISAICGYKAISLRKFCFSQIQKGIGEQLYVEKQGGPADKESEEDDDDGDDEE